MEESALGYNFAGCCAFDEWLFLGAPLERWRHSRQPLRHGQSTACNTSRRITKTTRGASMKALLTRNCQFFYNAHEACTFQSRCGCAVVVSSAFQIQLSYCISGLDQLSQLPRGAAASMLPRMLHLLFRACATTVGIFISHFFQNVITKHVYNGTHVANLHSF